MLQKLETDLFIDFDTVFTFHKSAADFAAKAEGADPNLFLRLIRFFPHRLSTDQGTICPAVGAMIGLIFHWVNKRVTW
jgi:hypothetical protein